MPRPGNRSRERSSLRIGSCAAPPSTPELGRTTRSHRNGHRPQWEVFIPGFTKINFTLEQLREEDPRVVIFKPGFSIAGGHNSYPIGAPSPGAHRSSPLRGKRIEVKSLSGDMDRYLRELSLVSATLSDLSASGDLGSVPKLVHAMVCEKRRLKSVLSQKFLLDVPGETSAEASCGSNVTLSGGHGARLRIKMELVCMTMVSTAALVTKFLHMKTFCGGGYAIHLVAGPIRLEQSGSARTRSR